MSILKLTYKLNGVLCSMNAQQNKLQNFFHWFGSRLALNIYFWMFLFLLKQWDVASNIKVYPILYYSMIVFYLLFFIALSYINNFVLLPKFLFRQKRIIYFMSVLALLFGVSYLYTFFIKWLPQIIYEFDSLQVSIVMSPVSNNLSFMGILDDMQSYFAIMVVWIIIFSLLGFYHHGIDRIKRMQEAINKHRDTELAFLKNQINPHFLFNTLNNLYALSLKKSDEAPESILKLSNILRYILYESDSGLIPFEKEKDILQAYVDIELLRLSNISSIRFSIMSDQDYNIPPLLWLPIIENVFKHTRLIEKLEVDFRFNINQNNLTIYCKNNMHNETNKNELMKDGIGLNNLHKRLSLLYPEKHSLVSTTENNYFSIDLSINLD